MRLQEWIDARPHGELRRLSASAAVPYNTVLRIASGKPASYATAERLSLATGGVVTVRELCLPNGQPSPNEPRRRRASRRPSSAAA